jgi:hypothetical protein
VVQRAAARHRTTGSFDRRRGQGGKRKTSAREDHYIELQALRKHFVTSRELKNDLRCLRLDTRKEISRKTMYKKDVESSQSDCQKTCNWSNFGSLTKEIVCLSF